MTVPGGRGRGREGDSILGKMSVKKIVWHQAQTDGLQLMNCRIICFPGDDGDSHCESKRGKVKPREHRRALNVGAISSGRVTSRF